MIHPSLLSKNDRVHVISPAGRLAPNGLDDALATLKSWGLIVSMADHVYESDGVFSGTDAQRLNDFQAAINNESIKLILCARGGYGLTRYIDQLDLSPLIESPKWIVGFSDITAFHLKALKQQVLSIHGPVGTSFGVKSSDSINSLYQLLFKGHSTIESEQQQLKSGIAEGDLIGGNLSLICESLGTATEIDTDNKILVIEDVGDYFYRIDRMLNQLERAGKFLKLKGLVLGGFSKLENGSTPFTETVNDMVSRLTVGFNYPIATSMPIGHEAINYSFVQGAKYTLTVKNYLAQLKIATKL